MGNSITDKTKIPLSWLFIVLGAIVTTVFAAGMWAASVNAKLTDHTNQLTDVTEHLKSHDKAWISIDHRLTRIEVATGADKLRPENEAE